MLLNAEEHFPSPVELRGDAWIRMKRGVESAAELGQVFENGCRIGVVRGEGPFIGQRPTAEKFFRLTRHYFVAIGMMDFIALAAAGAASIICCCCCCCCRPWRIFCTVSQLLRHLTGTA